VRLLPLRANMIFALNTHTRYTATIGAICVPIYPFRQCNSPVNKATNDVRPTYSNSEASRRGWPEIQGPVGRALVHVTERLSRLGKSVVVSWFRVPIRTMMAWRAVSPCVVMGDGVVDDSDEDNCDSANDDSGLALTSRHCIELVHGQISAARMMYDS
jgi:hypothetical protein